MKHRSSSSNRTPPGQRQLRVAERIRHILASVMMQGKLHDPVLSKSSLISVSAVEIGPDLKHATAYVMPLGGKNAEAIVKALNDSAGLFRSELGAELDLRYTPKVTFKIDHSFEEADHINRLLNQERVRRDIEKEDEE